MVQIRLATEEDQDVIADFQLKMALETEDLRLDEKTVREGVLGVFRDPSKGKYFVATEDKQVIASTLLTNELSDWRNQWFLWIQSVYVLREKRGKGVFRKMYETIKEMVEEDASIAGLKLYVDSENESAIATYKAIGMDGEHYKLFEWYK
ncbi:MAG: GNAT family N-acetyltransferase [Marinilabiliales bacterium]|nr:MAG: GNAT family N-acetyltransferase [Marinilabiliales bacterium]